MLVYRSTDELITEGPVGFAGAIPFKSRAGRFINCADSWARDHSPENHSEVMSGNVGARDRCSSRQFKGSGWTMKRAYFLGAFIIWFCLYARANSIFSVKPISLDVNIDPVPMENPAFVIKFTAIEEENYWET